MGIIQAQQEGQRLTTLTGLITSVKEDVWWRVLGVNEGDVNCGSIEVWEWLLKNTVDFAFFSSKVSTFVNPSSSKWYLSNLCTGKQWSLWFEMILVTSVSCCLCCHKMESPYPLLDSPGEVVIISRPGFRLDFPKLTTRISQKWRLPFDLLAWSIRSFPLQGETNPTVWFMGCLIYRRCHSRQYTHTSRVRVDNYEVYETQAQTKTTTITSSPKTSQHVPLRCNRPSRKFMILSTDQPPLKLKAFS